MVKMMIYAPITRFCAVVNPAQNMPALIRAHCERSYINVCSIILHYFTTTVRMRDIRGYQILVKYVSLTK